MNKILIIGQAPPSQKQVVPYDTTLLYVMLAWIGIDKEQAQEMFIFDAVMDAFPGFDESFNHKKPTVDQFHEYLNRALYDKIVQADKLIIFGNVAKEMLLSSRKVCEVLVSKHYITLMHPSKRNFARIMRDKDSIASQLDYLINEGS